MTPTDTLITGLADYAHGIGISDVPAQVRRQAALCILDTVGCMVAGLQDESWRAIDLVERKRSGLAEATVVGLGQRLCVEGAARLNAYLGDLFELNDLIGGHASIGVVSAMLALAESLDAPASALVEAVLVGNEVTARVYMGYYPAIKPYTETGMCPVTFPSSLGVAAGAAKLLGLTAHQMAHAMAIAGGLASWCPSEVIYGGGGSFKPMLHGSCPAESGLRGAWYAQQGMTGPLRLLESEIGYFATAARRSFPANVLDRETWYVGAPRRKWHAACGYTHSAIDTVVALRQQGHPVDRAHRIRIEVPPYTLPGVSKTAPPSSPNVARFHLQYCVALAVHGADTILPAHSLEFEQHLRRPELVATMAAIEVAGNPELSHYHQCRVELLDQDAQVLVRLDGSGPRGTPQNPLSDEEVVEKFVRMVAPQALSREQAITYARGFADLESQPDWRWIVESFAGAGARA
ncbi:MAG: MmgE/PrpD family protein [Pseudomonadota bacterium]